MEEACFLLSMQWRVRGIQIQNDGARCFPVGLQEERDQPFIDGFRSLGDLVVALGRRRTRRRQFQLVQSAFPRQGFREIALSGQHTQQWILP